MGIHPLVQVILGAGLGYAVAKYVRYRVEGGEGVFDENPRRYETRSKRTRRAAATGRCVARVDGECKFPVGDQYHQRLALAYVRAGRCSMTEKPTCSQVVNWVASHGSGEAKQVAKLEKADILASARRSKSRRSRTRARRKKKSYR